MSINSRRLADGRTVYDVRLRDPSGRTYKRTLPTKREAQDFAAKERVDQRQGTWVDPRQGKVQFSEYAATWLNDRTSIKGRTRDLYELELRRYILPTLGEFEMGSITAPQIRTWHKSLFDRGYAQSTCAKAYRMLRTIMSTAVEDGVISKNPCNIKGAGVAKSPERPIATLQQVFDLADAIDPRYRLAVLLGTFASLRLGELLALTRERVNFDSRTVSIIEQLQERSNGEYLVATPKTEAGRRSISLPSFMMEEIAVHLAEYAEPGKRGRLFRGAEGGPLRRAVLFRAWDEARRQTGLEHLHFHDLRHTGNTLAASTGASTKELMARMGHASAEAALRYQHATRERDEAIADRLDSMAAALTAERVEPDRESNVASMEEHRAACQRRAVDKTRHERAMVDDSTSDQSTDDASDQDFDWSGRRESNSRSQLGKLMFCR